jgi:hypothetical protein
MPDTAAPAPWPAHCAAPRLTAPIFVVGASRSGTTLLRSLLSAHPRIAVSPESHFVPFAAGHGLAPGAGPDAGPADWDGFWRALGGFQRFRDVGAPAARAKSLAEAHGERSFRSAFAGMLLAYGEMTGKRRIGEKTPRHVNHVDTLLAWFPDATVVFVVRDPRGMVASQLATPWIAERMAKGRRSLRGSRAYQIGWLAQLWQRTYGQIQPRFAGHPRVEVLRYEDLVTAPEPALRGLCTALGEAFDPAMLSERSAVPPPAATDEVASRSWGDWRLRNHADSLAPISRDPLDKWRRDLTPGEAAAVEAVCGVRMAHFGYRSETAGVRSAAAGLRARALLTAGAAEEAVRRPLRRLRG